MSKFSYSILFVLIAVSGFASEEAIPMEAPDTEPKQSLSWNASVGISYTDLAGKSAALFNGSAGIMVSPWLSIGMGGGGLLNRLYTLQPVSGSYPSIGVGYAGLMGGLHFLNYEALSFSLRLIAGAGGLNYGYHSDTGNIDGGNIFGHFVLVPELSFDWRFSENLGIGVNARYLGFFGDDEYLGISTADLSGLSVGLAFNFYGDL